MSLGMYLGEIVGPSKATMLSNWNCNATMVGRHSDWTSFILCGLSEEGKRGEDHWQGPRELEVHDRQYLKGLIVVNGRW